MDTKYFGILGGPGVGKGTVLEIIKQNTSEIAKELNQSNVSVYLARKFTTRPSRDGETDKVGNQSIDDVKQMLGSYQLMGKHWYGYPEEELFNTESDLVILEPSIHQLEQLREQISPFYVVGLIKPRELREKGLRDRIAKGDNTMNEEEIAKRLQEGDKQESEILKAQEQGLIDVVWSLGEGTWSDDPVHEGKLREMVLITISKYLES